MGYRGVAWGSVGYWCSVRCSVLGAQCSVLGARCSVLDGEDEGEDEGRVG